MKKLLIIISTCLLTLISYAQVGIGTTSPDASSALDITSLNSGLLIPRVSLVNVTNGTAPIATPATSLLVWNTNASVVGGNGIGYYYWDGIEWLSLTQLGDNLGNHNATTTLDLNSNDITEVLRLSTLPSSDYDKLRVYNNSSYTIGFHSAMTYGFVNDWATTFTMNNDSDRGWVWRDVSDGQSDGAMSLTTDGRMTVKQIIDIPYTGDVNGTSGAGGLQIGGSLRIDGNEVVTNNNTLLYLQNGNNGDLNVDSNTLYVDASANRVGIGDIVPAAKLEVNTVVNETALRVTKSTGSTDAATIYNNGTGNALIVASSNTSTNDACLVVRNQSNNQYSHGITVSSGGYYSNVGFVGISGVWGINSGVSGINAAAERVGVHGRANNANLSTIDKMGGFFNVSASLTNSVPAAAAVGAVIDNTTYKILGFGAVSTLVKDANGDERIMVAPESPEALFQDYGIGQLSGGRAIITLDPILTKNIYVSEEHPLKVFVQLEGDCNGVYVTKKTASGFEVVELNNGVSNTKFSYQIVARRADEERGGRVSKYSEMRFKPLNRKFVVNKNKIHTSDNKSKEENPSSVTSQDSSSEIKQDYNSDKQEDIKSDKRIKK